LAAAVTASLPLPGADGGLIETEAGPAFVRTIGSGPPVLVFHGGPGFSHDHLRPILSPLAPRRRLIFFDQPGCGGTPAPPEGVTPAATYAQARAMLRRAAVAGQVGVIAHSWGVLVLAAAFAGVRGEEMPAPDEGLLINPVALCRAEWDAALAVLLSRGSAEAIGEFMALVAAGEGARAMPVVLPLYTLRGYAVPVPPFGLNAATYARVAGALGDFDYSTGARAFGRLTLLAGQEDFTSIDLIQPLVAACAHVVRPALGHFPFFEAPAEFAGIIGGLFR
jgi:pimeloyl-ACP methyl ester carboxylesterase